MIRLAITRHHNVAFGCVEPVTAAASGGWRTRTITATASLFIEWVSVRTAPTDSHVLGLWRSKDIAMAATEWAALPQTSRREPAVSIDQLDVRERKREARQ
jgi:hypothetical protein